MLLAAVQGASAAIAFQNQGVVIAPGPQFVFVATVTLVAGTMFLMWLGEQITERGLGNGISMIILAGIVAGLPAADRRHAGNRAHRRDERRRSR